jgi:hypothetical protein
MFCSEITGNKCGENPVDKEEVDCEFMRKQKYLTTRPHLTKWA